MDKVTFCLFQEVVYRGADLQCGRIRVMLDVECHGMTWKDKKRWMENTKDDMCKKKVNM